MEQQRKKTRTRDFKPAIQEKKKIQIKMSKNTSKKKNLKLKKELRQSTKKLNSSKARLPQVRTTRIQNTGKKNKT